MSFSDYEKQVDYSGYNTSGEFKVEYAYDAPIQLEGGVMDWSDQNRLSATTRFFTLPSKRGDVSETRRRFQEISARIPDANVPASSKRRTITVDYDANWKVDHVEFKGDFLDDAGKVRTLSMRLGGDLHPFALFP